MIPVTVWVVQESNDGRIMDICDSEQIALQVKEGHSDWYITEWVVNEG